MSTRVGFGAVRIKSNEPGSLDYIDSSSFRHRDICLVNNIENMKFYTMDQYSGVEEETPFIIKPSDIDPQTELSSRLKRWKLVSQEIYNSNIIQKTQHYIETSLIKTIEGEDIIIQSADQYDVIIQPNGKIIFPLNISVSYPEQDNHLTNKSYLNDIFTDLESNIQDYLNNYIEQDQYLTNNLNELQDIIYNYLDFELETYVSNSLSTLDTDVKNYTDTEVGILEDNINNNYKYLVITNNQWIEDGEYYYTDIEHNLGKKDFLVSFFIDGEKIFPVKMEKINNDNLRVWMLSDNVEINVSVFHIEESS